MKRYRIVYWFNLVIVEWFTKADSEEGARAKFEREKGNAERIIKVEEI